MIICTHCGAPHIYIYFNDGKKRTQLKCKVCKSTFQIQKRYRKSKKDFDLNCPYCGYKLYEWKVKDKLTIYKCGNKKCDLRQSRLKSLSPAERMMQKLTPTHFKLNYQYREYHLTEEDLKHSEPEYDTKVNLSKIYSSSKMLGLILSLHVSFSLSSRKTALFINQMYGEPISGQTVLNYAKAAAPYCHKFNMENKGSINNLIAGDETYIKVKGKHHYIWFFISIKTRQIIAYHVSDSRDTEPAITAMLEAIRTARKDQRITMVVDGNPSYGAGRHYINNEHETHKNKKEEYKLKLINVIGLKNQDAVSTKYRAFKQIIERLNRTYKQHSRVAAGFNTFNGAVSHTALFVTHYNFLRPHNKLSFNVPAPLPILKNCRTLPERWLKIISLAA